MGYLLSGHSRSLRWTASCGATSRREFLALVTSLVVAISCGGGGGVLAPPRPPLTAPLADRVDALFINAEKQQIFSGSVLVIDGGKTVLTKSYGLADRARKRPNDPQTIFRIGSVTKSFTATAVLALV